MYVSRSRTIHHTNIICTRERLSSSGSFPNTSFIPNAAKSNTDVSGIFELVHMESVS